MQRTKRAETVRNHGVSRFAQLLTIGMVSVLLLGSGLQASPALALSKEPPPDVDEEAVVCLADLRGTLSSTPRPVPLGQTATLRWHVTVPSSCASIGVTLYVSNQVVPPTGSRTIRPLDTMGSRLHAVSGGRTRTLATAATIVSKDLYCAYPVLLFTEITDAHEGNNAGPLDNGPEAYMYFATAVGPKVDNYAASLGSGVPLPGANAPPQTQYFYETNGWASNFRGPHPVGGESGRTQWEWSQEVVDDLGYEAAQWGGAGTPYTYGQSCLAVGVGAAPPNMGDKAEDVYEHDEWINDDDYVGGVQLSRRACETDVWGKGYATGWTNMYVASVWGDIADVRYKLWCYSCTNTTTGCGMGVGPE